MAVPDFATADRHCDLIVAYARGRVIGWRGGLPWRHAEDLARFRRLSMGHTLIMGRRTWDSLAGPLDGRLIIILSRQASAFAAPGTLARDWDQALALARRTDPRPLVCGGEQIYRLALPSAARLYLTEIAEDWPGDCFFPAVDERDWHELERAVHGPLLFRTLERRPP